MLASSNVTLSMGCVLQLTRWQQFHGMQPWHVQLKKWAEQLRAFNAPFQLGKADDRGPEVDASAPDDRFETPSDAALVRVPIRDGDVVVLATDGERACPPDD